MQTKGWPPPWRHCFAARLVWRRGRGASRCNTDTALDERGRQLLQFCIHTAVRTNDSCLLPPLAHAVGVPPALPFAWNISRKSPDHKRVLWKF